jgi:hypothetical protein
VPRKVAGVKAKTAPPPPAAPTADPERLRLVGRVAAVATIQAVLLKELKSERMDELPKGDLSATNAVTVGFGVRERGLYVTIRFVYKTEPPALSIDAIFNLHYRLDEERTQQEMEAFAQINGVFNAWPYWRELVQSTASRMLVAVPAVPPLRI